MADQRFETDASDSALAHAAFTRRLNKLYGWYTVGFIAFVSAMAVLEQFGLKRQWIGSAFLFAPIALYAGIGVLSRTTDATEYYVAGRRVPAIYNGMATSSRLDDRSVIHRPGRDAVLERLRRAGFHPGLDGRLLPGGTVARALPAQVRPVHDSRLSGRAVRRQQRPMVGILAAILCSFTYVVAQIYGVGLIATRLTGVAFEIGIFLGLGGVLVCSFLGGMRAVTWTQVRAVHRF